MVKSWPLAVCDARTATDDDFVELSYVTKELVRLSYMVKWNEKHQFYYMSNMTDQEVCIFKIFDSNALDGTAGSMTPCER